MGTILGPERTHMKALSLSIFAQMEKSRKLEKPGFSPPDSSGGQAYTEYVIILAVLFALGIGVASVFTGKDALQEIFYDYYASLANYLNLPFF
jgi:hypothetical protein